MPVRPPALDDRNFDDLVDEVLARIPAHTPEWTNPRLGDPGRTLIELFAWLTDTLLYRANLIPERQRLVFLKLLGIPMRPAQAARGLVSVFFKDDAFQKKEDIRARTIRPLARLIGPVNFETREELMVLPITAELYYKRSLTESERDTMRDLLDGLQQVYRLNGVPTPYVTTPVFPDGAPDPAGFDLVRRTVDGCLWIALLSPKPEWVAETRQALGATTTLSIGVAPAIITPELFEEIGPRTRIPHVWELSNLSIDGEVEYLTLETLSDSTNGLTERGVTRLALPSEEFLDAPGNDVRTALDAGVGDRPPRIDDAEVASRVVTWVRLRPAERLESLSLSWVGVNAVESDQRQTLFNRILGESDGSIDQMMQLPGQSVEAETLELQVEVAGSGFQMWRRVEDLTTAGRDDAAYSLDSEAGIVRFGNGIRGSVPETGRRVRVARMRAGGGAAGNLPAGSLNKIEAFDLGGAKVETLRVVQMLATDGGANSESLVEAEQRIPALFRHGNRAVTEEDYRRLAAATPSVRLGRVEVLPRFKPHQRSPDVPGVVSVMIWPSKTERLAPHPRPDRPTIEAVHQYLDQRRPLGVELYVISCEYIALGLAVGVEIRDGFGRETTLNAVRESLRQFLWPLAPGGTGETGWPLGGAVNDRELAVEVARTPGVGSVRGINLFTRAGRNWQEIARANACASVTLALRPWQLPELLSIVVVEGEAPPDLRSAPNPFDPGPDSVAVPVVPDLC
ncbi:MAG: putative baseplate assembly protein [Verrucomicrobia subdivision 3 bacterium]|nr:putative baseplate assembly protein [Limisphaerales bacterium]